MDTLTYNEEIEVQDKRYVNLLRDNIKSGTGLDVDAKDFFNETLLIRALKQGFNKTVTTLVYADADLTVTDAHGHSLLYNAYKSGNWRVLIVFRDLDLEFNTTDKGTDLQELFITVCTRLKDAPPDAVVDLMKYFVAQVPTINFKHMTEPPKRLLRKVIINRNPKVLNYFLEQGVLASNTDLHEAEKQLNLATNLLLPYNRNTQLAEEQVELIKQALLRQEKTK